MINKAISKSAYIEQMFKQSVESLQDPNNQAVMQLQADILQEFTNPETTVNGIKVQLEKMLDSEGEPNMEDLEQLMGVMMTKVVLKFHQDAMAKFVNLCEKNITEYEVVTVPQNVMGAFLSACMDELLNKEDTREQAEHFMKAISAKFEAKIMLLDDEMKPEISRYKTILLDDGETVVRSSHLIQNSEASSILVDLLVNNKEMNGQFLDLIQKTVPKR